MTPEVKKRIEQIRQGIVPEGYKKGKIGIVPIKWNEVPFSTLFTSTSEYTDDLKQYPLYSLTIEDGITAKTERYERSHLVKKENSYKVVRPNDYAYNPMNIRFGAVARHKGDIPVAVSGYYDIFTTVHESDLVFMDSFLTYGPMITYYNKVSTGSLVEKQRVHFSDFLEFSLALPPLEERKKIAEILSTQDKAIELQGRKIEELKRFKKGCLEKMFPQKGQKVPEKRFPGFTDDWEQRKLSEVFSSYTDPVDIPHDGYERLGIRSHAKGTFHSYVPAGHELQTAQMHRVAANKFIVNITFGWEHAVAVTDENDAGKLVSHRFPQFSLSDELDPQFLKFIILDERFRHHLWLASPGGAGRNRVLNLNQMLQYEIQIPCVAEQRKIAGALINIDTLITLHQRKLEEMKKQKKALMQLLLTGIVRVRL